ncbi:MULTISPECIES: flagellar biosynthesis protein FlhA [Carnobacterium]|uniref:Flagellar biosynthesis protein FlhA n=2 Tax=Carnobacterium inhibens TaxID=147709 RepID=U5SAP6_9LACT|nr:flagellar biosynthesis protein FlhA [Carnobacterium inhibens]AGY82330.1 flagellar biosynthesis protein FlhA [Carnobacterium inhibens subsp. gilichinskyi]MBC9824472.1 flagellar biosynthesis protein FlhA [Carnobacterium inhibens]
MSTAFWGKLEKITGSLDVIVAFFVMAILAMIIIPLPSGLLDLMLVINIALSITILLLTLFTKNVLEFSTFPTILLITTMFRLALNISSTRLILTEGEAGAVIETFANFVAGSNFVVGAVIFIIIVIIQMMVVTNGSSRVSEVSARFTLDAMPGKQMAIDADLNSGLINEEQAKKRRSDLERETQFFGAMDGASKFVKGDAMAGIIITVINLIGGVAIHSLQNGMPIMEALMTFGKLTIGDGLVSQIPSLLISVASGILVTRSGSLKGFGSSMGEELFGSSKVMMMLSVILLLFAIMPGFPTIPFLLLGVLSGAAGYLLMENEKSQKTNQKAKEMRSMAAQRTKSEKTVDESVASFQVDPISIEIGYGLIPIADENQDNNLMSHITTIRKQSAHELGILLSPIRIRDNLQLKANDYVIKIKGNVIARGELYLDKYMIVDPGETEFDFDGIPTKEPAFGLDAMWVNESDREAADLRGYTVVDPITVLVTHLKETIYKSSYELLGRQEVKQLLEGIKDKYGVVIDELIPDILRLGEVQKVLQNLLKENIPINDLVTILETLADYGNTTKDSEMLTEYVRQALKRTVVKPYLNEQDVLQVVTILPDTEELITRSIQKSSAGSIPILQPDTVTKIFDSITAIHNQLSARGIPHVLLASPKVRPALKNLLTYNFPDLAVVSLNEVPNDVPIETVGMIEG